MNRTTIDDLDRSWPFQADSELDTDEEEAERRKAVAAKQQQPPAFVDVEDMDDEVERVLGHRCAACRLKLLPDCCQVYAAMRVVVRS